MLRASRTKAPGLPELVVTGVRLLEARDLLNVWAYEAVHRGKRLSPATAVALFRGATLRALQLVWPDDRGHWPWDVGFRSRRGGQPVLGARSEGGPF